MGTALTRLAKTGPGWLPALIVLFSFAADAAARCWPVAQIQPGFHRAALPEAGTLRLTFLGHSSFLIETPGGASAVTDFNGFLTPSEPPDIVTMNNAHDTHYTDFVDPDIEMVLRGWGEKGGIADHDLTYKDLRVWNLPTNVRDVGGTRFNGNSIFVFEAADLCVAHLGHLHHLLTDEDLGVLGQIDVLLAPVDGAFTMAQEFMVEVIHQISPAVVIPMHYFNPQTLRRFLALIHGRYEIVASNSPRVTFSRLDLPYRKVIVLPGGG